MEPQKTKLMNVIAGSRHQVGASFSIELHGINWAVLDGEDVVCMMRGRSDALRMATQQQRQRDEHKMGDSLPRPMINSPGKSGSSIVETKTGRRAGAEKQTKKL